MKHIFNKGNALHNVLFSVPYASYTIPTIISGTIMASFIDLYTLNQEVKANMNQLGPYELFIYTFLKIFGAGLLYMCNLLSVHLVSSALKNASQMFFSEYINLNMLKFQRIGVGAIGCSIKRRSMAITKFLQIISMRFLINFVCLAVIIYKFTHFMSFITILKSIAILMAFIVIISAIQYKRATLRKKINKAIEKNSTKLMDILVNYERIVAYNNEDIECKKYRKALRDTVVYKRVYETLYVFLAYLTCIAFLMTTITIYSSLNTNKNIDKSDLKEIFFIAVRLNATIYALLQDFNMVYTSYFNFQTTDDENHELVDENNRDFFFQLHKHVEKIEIINLEVFFNGLKTLKSVNLSINRGDKIAICGPSSSGKSVFLKALMGSYGYKGAIIFDGFEQKQVKKKSLLNQIAYIPQDIVLFDKTLMENLKLGNEHISDEKVIVYCEMFKLHSTFKALGYNNSVGSLGKKLSGGQRQKVVFMRTIIKSAPILIMDQAMSALDMQTEKFFMETLKMYLKNSTLLFVTKNMKTLSTFDKILYFDDGEVKGMGSLDDLMENNENFRKYYMASLSENKMTK